MVWKNGKTGFHGVEVFPKLASMVWKNGENGFHAVEDFLSDDSQKKGRKATGTKVGSMPWNFSEKWLPFHGKTLQVGFHGVENRRIRLPCRGTFPGVPENDDSPCGGRERRPAAAWTSFPNPSASKAPSTSSSASTPPRQRQQPLNPVGARTLPPPIGHCPLELATLFHWQQEKGFWPRSASRPAKAAAFRFSMHGAWAEVCNLSGGGVIFRQATCNQGMEGTT